MRRRKHNLVIIVVVLLLLVLLLFFLYGYPMQRKVDLGDVDKALHEEFQGRAEHVMQRRFAPRVNRGHLGHPVEQRREDRSAPKFLLFVCRKRKAISQRQRTEADGDDLGKEVAAHPLAWAATRSSAEVGRWQAMAEHAKAGKFAKLGRPVRGGRRVGGTVAAMARSGGCVWCCGKEGASESQVEWGGVSKATHSNLNALKARNRIANQTSTVGVRVAVAWAGPKAGWANLPLSSNRLVILRLTLAFV